MYAIKGEFRRFCFDQAVTTFGLALEAELDSCTGKTDKEINGKRSRVLAKWLDQPMRYREPQAAPASPTAGPTTPQSSATSGG